MKTAFLAMVLALMIISVTSRSTFEDRFVREYLSDLAEKNCDEGRCYSTCLFTATYYSCRKKCCDDCYAACMVRGTKTGSTCRHECKIPSGYFGITLG